MKKNSQKFKQSFSIQPWKEESSRIPFSLLVSQRSSKKHISLLDSERRKLKRVSSLAGRDQHPISNRKNNYSKYLSGEYLAKTIKEIGFLEKRGSKAETKKKKKQKIEKTISLPQIKRRVASKQLNIERKLFLMKGNNRYQS